MKTTFTVKEQHIKLLKSAYVSWDGCEFGAPAIDCKRPYGNGNVIRDMVKILFGEMDEDTQEKLEENLEDFLINLHNELKDVLQIFLSTGEMKAGKYQKKDYTKDWEKVENE